MADTILFYCNAMAARPKGMDTSQPDYFENTVGFNLVERLRKSIAKPGDRPAEERSCSEVMIHAWLFDFDTIANLKHFPNFKWGGDSLRIQMTLKDFQNRQDEVISMFHLLAKTDHPPHDLKYANLTLINDMAKRMYYDKLVCPCYILKGFHGLDIEFYIAQDEHGTMLARAAMQTAKTAQKSFNEKLASLCENDGPRVNFLRKFPAEIRLIIHKLCLDKYEVFRDCPGQRQGPAYKARNLLDPKSCPMLFVCWQMRNEILLTLARHATISFGCWTKMMADEKRDKENYMWMKPARRQRFFRQFNVHHNPADPSWLISFPLPDFIRTIRLELYWNRKDSANTCADKVNEFKAFVYALLQRTIDIGSTLQVQDLCSSNAIERLPDLKLERLDWVNTSLTPLSTMTSYKLTGFNKNLTVYVDNKLYCGEHHTTSFEHPAVWRRWWELRIMNRLRSSVEDARQELAIAMDTHGSEAMIRTRRPKPLSVYNGHRG